MKASDSDRAPIALDPAAVRALLAQRFGLLEALQFSVTPLRGGLDSSSVCRVVARYSRPAGRAAALSVVVKSLDSAGRREASVYRYLEGVPGRPCWPEAWAGPEEHEPRLLCLEAIRPVSRWPWRRPELVTNVMKELAALHVLPLIHGPHRSLLDWAYEPHLQTMAAQTLRTAERLLHDTAATHLKRSMPALRRVVRALRDIRRDLLDRSPLPRTFIHGDVHPGNVIVRRRRRHDEPVLIDWARARIGSPLEDVASWLQSLGFWSDEARRRHDTLLVAYLGFRGHPPLISREIRTAYWYAAASNALAGALLHHLRVATDVASRRPAERATSLRALRDWLRVVRRADAARAEATRRSDYASNVDG
jgi:Ser/Thr protein kinase RdoA (MazF antagonist)